MTSFADKVTVEELNKAFSILEDRYAEPTEKIFLKMGRYMRRNLLSIPENVVLPEDQVHGDSETVDENDIDAEKKKFESTCQKIINAKYKRAILEGKLRNLKAVKERQGLLLKKARDLKNTQEALARYDAEAKILEAKTQVLLPIMNKLENNVVPVEELDAKRKFEENDEDISKRSKLTEED